MGLGDFCMRDRQRKLQYYTFLILHKTFLEVSLMSVLVPIAINKRIN